MVNEKLKSADKTINKFANKIILNKAQGKKFDDSEIKSVKKAMQIISDSCIYQFSIDGDLETLFKQIQDYCAIFTMN